METLLSLSRASTVVAWDLAVASTFAFGALFLFGWLSEEFATSPKWKARRKIFLTLAIIGVIGEQIGTIVEFALSEHLETIDAAEVAKTRLEAAQLEKAVAWRHLTAAQSAAVSSALKPFADENVNVFAYFPDLEGWQFADQLAAAARKAGWKVQFARIVWSRVGFTGVWVWTTPKATERDRTAAKHLADILRREGVVEFAPNKDNWNSVLKGQQIRGAVDSNAGIWLTVGAHPTPAGK